MIKFERNTVVLYYFEYRLQYYMIVVLKNQLLTTKEENSIMNRNSSYIRTVCLPKLFSIVNILSINKSKI
ncbi:hypothetical protein HNQ80_000370 [Anaerosolibacter carboniphilus]|uniref:Uncharacterized protein n=1 Tax=Anaerosolibacter carboniphilus TaxID=1417629 RepID=A0A841KM29_9FIRM|nr:hypothetical protein [Anaerosolibacter carboniphilus]